MIAARSCLLAGLLMSMNAGVSAGQWRVIPTLTLGETWSSNIELDDNNKNSDLITQITPGIGITGRGRRLTADLDYSFQNLIFADNSGRSNSNHRLRARASSELVEDWLYLDASSQVTQQIVNGQGRISLDNFSVNNNRGDVGSINLSPYLQHDFAGVVTAFLRGTYGRTEFETGAADSVNTGVDFRLANGRHSGPLTWSVDLSRENIEREQASDVEFNSSLAQVGYRVGRGWSVLAQAGDEDNQFATTSTNSLRNGSFWAAGVRWSPGRRFSVEYLEGSRLRTATVNAAFSPRTNFSISYRNRDVGVNPGTTWSGSLSHRTRRTTWQATYFEDTITTQQLLATPILITDPETGETSLAGITDPVTGQISPLFGFTLTDDVLERQRATGSVQFRTAKSTIRFSAFTEKRDFLGSGGDEDVWGSDNSWTWRFAPRTSSTFTLGVRSSEFGTSGVDRAFSYINVLFERRIRPHMNGSIAYRHTRQDQDGNAVDYNENRLTARLVMQF